MPSTQSRVMFVTNSLTGGGAERATNILVNALFDAQVNVSLIAVNEGPLDLVEPRCEVFELHRKWKGGFFSVIKAYAGIQKVIWKWKPDLLVLNCDIPELLGSMTIGNHKLVVVEHASQPWPARKLLGMVIRKLLNFRKTKWVAVSDHLRVWTLGTSPDFVISNPINSFLPTAFTDDVRKFSKIRRLVFIGRLSPEKNPLLVASVAGKVNLPITFIGSGVLSEILREFCKHNGLTADFRGFVKDPWIETQPGDLLVVPSRNEGDGLVIVEAIQRGMPILAIEIPDLTRFGLLDINYFKNEAELVSIIESNRNHLGKFIVTKEIADLVLSKRSPDFVVEKWMEVFNKTI